ncbi:unnamed protein product [Caretta caretta]
MGVQQRFADASHVVFCRKFPYFFSSRISNRILTQVFGEESPSDASICLKKRPRMTPGASAWGEGTRKNGTSLAHKNKKCITEHRIYHQMDTLESLDSCKENFILGWILLHIMDLGNNLRIL